MTGQQALSGRTAVVTGGSSGLGRATAVALAQARCGRCGACPRSIELEDTADQVRSAGRRAAAVVVDLADAAAVEHAAAQVLDQLRGIDILVNAAGTDVPGPVAELDVESWDRVLGVNLRASFLLARAAWPHMVEAGGGTIINMSSVAGAAGGRPPRRTARRSSG